MGPNGRNNSCRSDSLVSSDKLVTRMVADSSTESISKNLNSSLQNSSQHFKSFIRVWKCIVNYKSSDRLTPFRGHGFPAAFVDPISETRGHIFARCLGGGRGSRSLTCWWSWCISNRRLLSILELLLENEKQSMHQYHFHIYWYKKNH